jgi:hypothetical protein
MIAAPNECQAPTVALPHLGATTMPLIVQLAPLPNWLRFASNSLGYNNADALPLPERKQAQTS